MPAINESTRRRRTRIATLLVALLPCVALARQQPAQQPANSDEVLRVTTEIVQTDVSVLDKSGKFVDGLRPEQFTLKVDGRPRAISFFERVVAGSVSEDAQIAAARGSGRAGGGPAAAVPPDRGRAVVFFIDDFHLSLPSTVHTREMLQRFIDKNLGQNDQMAVVTSTNQLGFLSQLTDDKNVLREAAKRIVARPAAELVDREQPSMNVAQALALERREQDVTDGFIDQTLKQYPEMTRDQARDYVMRRADALVDQNTAVVQRTFDSLRGVLRTYATYPGRKLFYFVSDGFALDIQRNSTYDRIRTLTDAAVRAGAVIYTIDARGLDAQLADLPRAEDSVAFDPSNRMNGATVSLTAATQEPLHTLAADTGGRAILNTNSPDAGIARALKETSVYYLLAWRPEQEENRGGRFRRIEVSVKDRPDLTVLVQRGFFGTPPPEPAARPAQKKGQANGAANSQADGASAQTPEQARAKELFAALRSPFPRADLPTAVTINYVRTQTNDITLSMSVQVELGASEATPGAGPPTDRAEVIGALYDDHGKVVNSFERAVSVTPTNDPAKPAGADGATADQPARPAPPDALRLTFAFQSPVKPGLYEARFASIDPKSRRTGSAVQWIDVPDVTGNGFAVSSIFLGVSPPAVAPKAGVTDKPGEPTPQVLVVPDRRFGRDPRVRFLIYAYNAAPGPGGRPDVAVQVQVFRDDQPVITTPLRKLNAEGFTDFSRLPYAAEMSLQGVPAGRYQLRVTAIDRVAKASATQSIKFAID